MVLWFVSIVLWAVACISWILIRSRRLLMVLLYPCGRLMVLLLLKKRQRMRILFYRRLIYSRNHLRWSHHLDRTLQHTILCVLYSIVIIIFIDLFAGLVLRRSVKLCQTLVIATVLCYLFVGCELYGWWLFGTMLVVSGAVEWFGCFGGHEVLIYYYIRCRTLYTLWIVIP